MVHARRTRRSGNCSDAVQSDLAFHGRSQEVASGFNSYGAEVLFFILLFFVFALLSPSIININAEAHTLGQVPYWTGGAGADFDPVPWPAENEWTAYTWKRSSINDPRVLDPSNGGTRPQNYVNVSSGCPDRSKPSMYISYDGVNDILFFRWRVEQIPNSYGTGPNPGAFGDVSPWKAAQWTVMMDTDGDGYREFGMQLDGATGMPASPIDILRTIYSNTLSQNMNPHDRDIFELWHNPTSFVNDDVLLGPLDLILNFQNAGDPVAEWPNGSAEVIWDYGTTRAIDISYSDVPPCSGTNENEYFVDYQIPMGMLSDDDYQFDCTKPSGLFFATANSLTNPFQKDVVAGSADFVATPEECVPFGDLVILCGPEAPKIVPEPVVDWVEAEYDASCTVDLSSKVRAAIVINSCTPDITEVNFYYYFDADADGEPDDGGTWEFIHAGSMSAADPTIWNFEWDTTGSGLQAGQYLIGVEAVSEIGDHTWSFLEPDDLDPGDPLPDGSNASADDYPNPYKPNAPSPIVSASTLINSGCGETVVVDKLFTDPPPVGEQKIIGTGDNIQFTITVHNNTGDTMQVNSVTDYLPLVAGSSPAQYFTYVSTDGGTLGPGTPSVSANAVTWNFSPAETIAAGGTGTITFTAQAPATEGTYQNTCSSNVDVSSWGATGRTIKCNYLEIGVGAPDLSIAKSADVTSRAAGEQINYAITYGNYSPANVTGAYITDVLPLGLDFVSASEGGTYDPATKTITWYIGDLQSGSGPFTVSFVAQVTDPYPQLAPIKVVNIATIYSNETAPKDAKVTVIVTGEDRPLLTIQKKGNKIFIDPTSNTASDRQVAYTIVFSNVGNVSAIGTTMTDPIPRGWTYVSSAAGTNCPAGTTTGNPVTSVTWNIGTLVAGGSGICNLVLEAKDSSSQPYTGDNPSKNTASIQATNFTPPVSSSYSVGLSGANMTCPGQTFYFHSQYGDVGYDGTKEIATVIPPGSGTAAYHYVSLLSQGCPTLDLVADFYQEPPLVNDGSLTTIKSQWYTTKTNGNPTQLYATVYDYDPATGTKTQLGQQIFRYTGADQTPVLNEMSVIPSSAPQSGHRLYWKYEACTDTQNQFIDLYYYYDGIVTYGNGKTVQAYSRFCYQGTSVVMNKTVDKVMTVPGDTLTYTVNFGNNGGNEVTGAVITDTLPAGVTFTSASLNGGPTSPSPCTQSGQVLTCPVRSSNNPSMGIISVGQQGSLVITVAVQNPFPSGIYELVNTAVLATNETEPITALATTAVATNVSIMKSVDNAILYPGDTATYTLEVLSSSGSAITVNLTDILPTDTYFYYLIGSASNGGVWNAGTHTLTWSNLTVPANGSVRVTFQMAVTNTTDASPPPMGTTYKDNTGTVTYGSQQYSNMVRVTILNGANLDITKTVDPAGPVSAGTEATFSMSVSNPGSQDALDVIVTDPIPAYSTYKAGTLVYQSAAQTDTDDPGDPLGDTSYFDAVNNQTVFEVGTLGSGETRTMSFTVVIDKPMPNGTTTLTNTAIASSSNTASKKATATLDVNDAPAFVLNKYAATLVASGQDITFTVYYRNTGGAEATSVVVTDTLAAGLTFVSADNGGFYDSGTRVVTWNLGSLLPDEEGALHLTVTPSDCGTYGNTATITSTEIPGGVVSNDGGPTTTVVCGLQPDKSTSTPEVTNSTDGTQATYLLTILNPTATTATGVEVTDNFSAGFSFDSSVAPVFGGNGSTRVPGSDINPVDGAIHATWGTWDIAAGGSLTIEFAAKVDASVPEGIYQNNVTAVSSNKSVLLFDELLTEAEDVHVIVPVDIAVTKTVDNASPSNSTPDNFTYTITMTNVGINHAFKVYLDDLLPAEVTYVSNTASQGSYDHGTGIWTVGRIDRNNSATLTITAYAKTGTAGMTIQNCAALNSSVPKDVNPDNDADCADIIPTLVSLTGFRAYVGGGKVVVEWETGAERDTVGFYIYRYDEKTGQYAKVNTELLPGLIAATTGGTYRLVDVAAVPSGKHLYKLVEVQNRGSNIVYGPFSINLGGGGDAGQVVKKFASDGTIEITIKGDVATTARKMSSSWVSGFEQVTGTFSRKAHGISAVTASRLSAAKKERDKTISQKQNRKGSSLKISVSSDGVYYLAASDISTKLDIPLQSVKQLIKSGNLALSCRDGKVAYTPAEDNAGLLFFGEPVNDIYTRENIYWLTVAKGLLMDSVISGKTSLGATSGDYFTETLHLEQDLIPAENLTNDPNANYWYWDWVMAGVPGIDEKSFSFRADSVSPNPRAAIVTVRLQGISDTGANRDHHAVINVNGRNVGEGKWDGVNPYTIVTYFDQDLLRNGDNTIDVKAVLEPKVDYSLFFIDSFSVSYARQYQAVDDVLFFNAEGNSSITVSGFSTSPVMVFNISDPLRPILASNASAKGKTENFSITFHPEDANAEYVAFAPSAVMAGNAIAALPSADLKNKKNSADYIVIAPEELKDAAKLLADYRQIKTAIPSGGGNKTVLPGETQSNSMTTMVVSLESIMDEFNYGILDPMAIRSFLQYAHKYWKIKPSYAVLVGNGTFDYKNIQGFGDNLLPALMVGTPMGLMPSDGVLGDFNGDNVPEIAIGRIPVLYSDELLPVIDKIRAFETTSDSGVIMLADVPDGAGNFSRDSDDIAQLFSGYYPIQKIYLSDYQPAQAKSLFFDSLARGSSFVNYLGHASYDQLSDKGLLNISDVYSLANSVYPVMTALTCSAGNFSIPGYDPLMALLVLHEGGGIVASWAPSGWSYNADAKMLGEGFYKAASEPGVTTVGEAVISSLSAYRITGRSPFMLNIMNILGDPALKLQ